MAKATIRTKLIEQLEAEGHSMVFPVHPRSTPKYLKFTIPGVDQFYFVGKAGGLRKGRCSSESVSMEGTVRDRLLARWDAAHKGK
jgi:hypothetical protein